MTENTSSPEIITSTEQIRGILESLDYPGVRPPDKPTKLLHIQGYVSSSGAVHNYALQLYHDYSDHNTAETKNVTAYRRLLRQSLVLAHKDFINVSPDDKLKYDVSDADIAAARHALIESWEASEQKEGAEGGNVRADDGLLFHALGAYFTSEKDPEVTALVGRIAISVQLVKEAITEKPSASGLYSKTPLIRAKELYKRNSPLARYLPRLNLRPSTVSSITLI